MLAPNYVRRWKYWINPVPVKPGVYRQKGGGCVVRARVNNPRTGRQQTINRALNTEDPVAAFVWLQKEIEKVRSGSDPATQQTPFAEFATTLYAAKVRRHEIRSAASINEWASILSNHLVPAFGAIPVAKITKGEIESWQEEIYPLIEDGDYSPVTANNWLRVLGIILRAAGNTAIDQIRFFDESEHETYTEEEPNSLTAPEVPIFLITMHRRFPQHSAMTTLGFTYGLRPSSLRALRRKGPHPDVLWDSATLRVRRSHTRGQLAMNRGKRKNYKPRIPITPALLAVLKWHVDNLPEGPMKDSDLLFPAVHGGFRTSGVLAGPFAEVAKIMGLTKRITPRAMRRTFQDLARAVNLNDLVTRSIDGHATQTMQFLYSTVGQNEMLDGVERVGELAGINQMLGDDD